MNSALNWNNLEVGYDIPARVGMNESEVQTPCLVVDLDALERNIKKMGDFAKTHGMRHRVHGKMHKSVDIALLQEKLGGSCGVCCQKVSEAEVFARGVLRMFWCRTKSVTQRSLRDWPVSQCWELVRLCALTTWLTSPNYRLPLLKRVPRSNAWLRSIVGQGVAV